MHQHAWLRRAVRANNSGTLLDRTLLASPRLASPASRTWCRSTCAGCRRGACTRRRGSPPSGTRAGSCSSSCRRPRTCGSATRSAAPPPPAPAPSLHTTRPSVSCHQKKEMQTNNGRGRVRKTRRARRKHACAHLRRRGAAGRRRARARPRGGRPSTPPFRCLLLYYSQTGSRARNGVVTSGLVSGGLQFARCRTGRQWGFI